MTFRHMALMPIMMGLMLGLMGPFALHQQGGSLSAIVYFILAHVAVAGVAAVALRFLLPSRFRQRVHQHFQRHRPRLAHLPFVGTGLLVGWAMICVFCIINWSISA